MHTIFGLPERKLNRGSKGYEQHHLTISSLPGLCLPENFPILICTGPIQFLLEMPNGLTSTVAS